MKIGVHKVAMASPSDVSELARKIDEREIDPAEIVALIGKTEGNGGANDFTRGFATLSYQLLLAARLQTSPEEIARKIAFVWSGGTEGLLSPRATIFTRSEAASQASGARLALGIETTRNILPEEVGTMVQVREVAEAVRRCLEQTGISDPPDVHYVQVKGPLLTPASIVDADRRGKKHVTRDPNGSKPFARGATALGVALGLGEVAAGELTDDVIAKRMDLFSTVASTSAGGRTEELRNPFVRKLGGGRELFPNRACDPPGYHRCRRCSRSVSQCRTAVLGSALCRRGQTNRWNLRQSGCQSRRPNWGRRTSMLSDADIDYERHARAARGAVLLPSPTIPPFSFPAEQSTNAVPARHRSPR